ncbi:MAG: (deoxy)nucleoside triphosphate pyrophosphohydrolase [Candidatus Latescibacterota bacterium]|jgi:8-oxo-dGTP diphosphatase|nr:MAG: (deoxy)nucleoside triphosphate pyrophosphohydrolase [Candidatus Latescibacterota bacterium]
MKIVTAAIIVSDGKVLIARRRRGDSMEGLWEFPGGSLEPGETLQACLERELFEELGVDAVAGDVVAESSHCDEHGALRLVALRAEIVSGEPSPAAHDEIAWVDPRDLAGYRLSPADVPIARLLFGEKDVSGE